MIIYIEQPKSFLCPEGYFKATLESIEPVENKRTKEVEARLTVSLDVPGKSEVTMLAARNFPQSLAVGSPLRTFLERWLGKDFFKACAKSEFELDTLRGKTGIAYIRHKKNAFYEEPFRYLEQVYPEDAFNSQAAGSGSKAIPKIIAPEYNASKPTTKPEINN